MAEVCIKIPKQLEQEVKESGIKWSVLLKRLIKHLEEEKEMIDWSVKLQRAGRKGRYEELKKRGVI